MPDLIFLFVFFSRLIVNFSFFFLWGCARVIDIEAHPNDAYPRCATKTSDQHARNRSEHRVSVTISRAKTATPLDDIIDGVIDARGEEVRCGLCLRRALSTVNQSNTPTERRGGVGPPWGRQRKTNAAIIKAKTCYHRV